MMLIKELREQLWGLGYRPLAVYNYNIAEAVIYPSGAIIPVHFPGKQPAGNDWQIRARRTPPAVITEPYDKQATNTGILCEGLRPIDIDIEDGAIRDQILALAFQHFGDIGPVRTRNNTVRCLLTYRATEGEPGHKVIRSPKESGMKHLVEILGRGQQFIAYGMHPSGAALEWKNGSPDIIPRDQLIAVTEEQIAAFLDAAAPLIGAIPPSELLTAPISAHEEREYGDFPGELLPEVIDAIPNTVDYWGWIAIGMAIHKSTNGGRDDLFHSFSARGGAIYNAKNTDAEWKRFNPTRTGVGKLIRLAKFNGWEDPRYIGYTKPKYPTWPQGLGPQSLAELKESALSAPQPMSIDEMFS
jgi:Primase C terminal 2 (PriCT-2)/Bifunctional DNA primase/polymerase, N-terminal